MPPGRGNEKTDDLDPKEKKEDKSDNLGPVEKKDDDIKEKLPKRKKVEKVKKWVKEHKKILIALGVTALAVGAIALAINLGPALVVGKMTANAAAWWIAGPAKQALLHNANMVLGEQLAKTYGAHTFLASGVHTFAGAELAKVAAAASAKVIASVAGMGLGTGLIAAGLKSRGKERVDKEQQVAYHGIKDELKKSESKENEDKKVAEIEKNVADRVEEFINKEDDPKMLKRAKEYIKEQKEVAGEKLKQMKERAREIAQSGRQSGVPFDWDAHYDEYGLNYGSDDQEESYGRGR